MRIEEIFSLVEGRHSLSITGEDARKKFRGRRWRGSKDVKNEPVKSCS